MMVRNIRSDRFPDKISKEKSVTEHAPESEPVDEVEIAEKVKITIISDKTSSKGWLRLFTLK